MSPFELSADGTPLYPPKNDPLTPESGPKDLENDRFEVDFGLNDEPSRNGHPGPACRIVLRVDAGYYGWVQGLAERLGLNISQTVAQGLLRLGEAAGYQFAMPARYTPSNPGRRRNHPRPSEPGSTRQF
jgi:hypothetical protein